MLDAARTTVLLGPPGTGKTTTLIGEVERELAAGTKPERIGYVSFTNKATNEARSRAAKAVGASRSLLRYFRTLHSMAFQQSGVTRAQIVQRAHMKEFGATFGVPVDGYLDTTEGTPLGGQRGDRLLFMENLARTRRVSIREQWEEYSDGQKLAAAEHFAEAYTQFRRSRGLLDFTDLLTRFIEEGFAPELDVLFVDEAQDLSTLQWAVVEKLARDVRSLWIAGDDDQAIYRFSGADVERFIGLEGDVRVLGQSYRVPVAVQGVASEILGRISHRREKPWAPREAQGEVIRADRFEKLDMSEGEWLVLARNRHFLDPIAAHCRAQGWVFSHQGDSSVSPAVLAAVKAWEDLRAGKTLHPADLEALWPYLAAGRHISRGAKAFIQKLPEDAAITMDFLVSNCRLATRDIWHQALDTISLTVRQYLVAALRRGEKLRREPRIALSTIHGAKGGQADNVVLIPDQARRSADAAIRFPDDEARVWYVAATRAKERLFILDPERKTHFRL